MQDTKEDVQAPNRKAPPPTPTLESNPQPSTRRDDELHHRRSNVRFPGASSICVFTNPVVRRVTVIKGTSAIFFFFFLQNFMAYKKNNKQKRKSKSLKNKLSLQKKVMFQEILQWNYQKKMTAEASFFFCISFDANHQ